MEERPQGDWNRNGRISRKGLHSVARPAKSRGTRTPRFPVQNQSDRLRDSCERLLFVQRDSEKISHGCNTRRNWTRKTGWLPGQALLPTVSTYRPKTSELRPCRRERELPLWPRQDICGHRKSNL